MVPGIIAQVPNNNPRFLPLAPEVFCGGVTETLQAVNDIIVDSFGLGLVADGFRVLFQDRDLDEASAPELLKEIQNGKVCSVRVQYRLRGGKGGFGSLLKTLGKKQKKKTTNYDSCRDLGGRRLRHSKAVERIKKWLTEKKAAEELVERLTVKGPEKPAKPEVTLDKRYIRQLKVNSVTRKRVIKEGLKKQKEDRAVLAQERAKKESLHEDPAEEQDDSADGKQSPAKRIKTLDSKIASEWNSLDIMSLSEESDSEIDRNANAASSSSKA